jgi:prepilin peptidase CpaA
MPDVSPDSILLVTVAAAFTATAAVWDVRQRRIPNKLTVPVFGVGLVYQAFHGWSGLADAGLGFLLGFGTLFVLWMIGGGGGGDVKLMGALSVWLGFQMTLLVLIVSTVIVVMVTGGYMIWSVLTGNFRKTARQHLATGKDKPTKRQQRKREKEGESVAEKQDRRVMAYAVPVAVATWMVLIWKLPDLP